MRISALLAFCLGLSGLLGPMTDAAPASETSQPMLSAVDDSDGPILRSKHDRPFEVAGGAPISEIRTTECEEVEDENEPLESVLASAIVSSPPLGLFPSVAAGRDRGHPASPAIRRALRATVIRC